MTTTADNSIDANEEEAYSYRGFTADALLAALAPQSVVLDVWRREQQQEANSKKEATLCQHPHDAWAKWIQQHLDSSHAPPQRYLTHLVRLYVQKYCHDGDDMTEDLTALHGVLQGTTRAIPDANECGHAAFPIPPDHHIIRIRVYPYHPDVSLRLWEAGATLAEYLIHQHASSSSQTLGHVVELGAGVGATGLALLAAKVVTRVVCTDYTTAALENMRHNFDRQQNPWLASFSCDDNAITAHEPHILAAHLDWNDYGTEHDSREQLHQHPDALLVQQEMKAANLLIAADVAYDHTVLPALARTVKRFLITSNNNNDNISSTNAQYDNPQHQQKRAIFATTKRNMATFQQLQTLLTKQEGLSLRRILAKESSPPVSTLPPILFPTKFHQSRAEVELWQLTYKDAKNDEKQRQ